MKLGDYNLFKIDKKRARSIMLYLFFVAISTVFWCFITINQDLQNEVTIKLEVMNMPENITFIDELPTEITVTIRDKGSTFVKNLLRGNNDIKINFKDYADFQNEKLVVSSSKLRTLVKNAISRSSSIIIISPEMINVSYTTNFGKKVPINYGNVSVGVTPGYIQNGRISTENGDSVLIFANSRLITSINEVFTYQVDAKDLTDTLRRKVNIVPITGIKVVPSTVELVVPVEQLVECTDTIMVTVRNNPVGSSIVAYPASVIAKYHTPKSKMAEHNRITAVVDYNHIKRDGNDKVAVNVGESPTYIQDVELYPDSVQCNYVEGK